MSAKGGRGKLRGHGEGGLYYSEARKRWLGVIELPATADGKRKRRKISGRTRAEVIEKLAAARKEIAASGDVAPATLTVEKLLADFVAIGLPSTAKSPITLDGYRWTAGKITAALGARKVKDLTVTEVEALLRSLAGEGYSKNSLVAIRATLRRALRWGMRDGRVIKNVAELADLPADAPRRESKALSMEQTRALLQAAAADRLEALVALGVCVPSRPGELTGLTWDDVDLDGATVSFRRALHRETVDGEQVLRLGALKTAQSRRMVQIPPLVVDALKRRRAAQAAERLRAGSGWAGSAAEHGGLVFATEAGGPLDPANVRRTLRRLAAKAGVPGVWTTYELRHTAVSILSASGVPLESIADLAGHKDPTVTSRVYRHQLHPVLNSAASVMQEVLADAQ